MPERTEQDKPAVTGNSQEGIETRLRLWPVLLILFLHFVAALGFRLWGSTNIHNAIALGGVPGISAILLIIWWLTASRAPWRYRLLSLALFFAVSVEIVLTQEFVN